MSESEQRHLQPWLHELAVAVDGHVTALSRRDGQVTGHGVEGLFVDDARVLSVLEVDVDGHVPAFVGSSARGATADFLASARNLGDGGADPSVEVLRRRRLVDGALREQVELRSRAAHEVRARVVARIGGDGAELADVKNGLADGTVLVTATADGALARWRTPRHDVRVEADGFEQLRPVDAGGVLAVADVRLAPGGAATLGVVVEASRREESLFDAEAASGSVRWSSEVVVEAADGRLGPLVEASVADLQHLLLSDPLDRRDVFAAAGTPWYLTLFGRDSLWTARFLLPLGPELAAGTLRALARRQGRVTDDGRAEAPGKIPHELRRIAFVDHEHGMHLPPVYYGTVDATSLWVCTLHDAWRWGMPEAEVVELLPALRSALDWITGAATGGDDFLRYVDETGTGLTNQGWKDSGDSIRWRDGRVAEAPIALIEAQAYAVEAARSSADLLDALGDDTDRARVSRLHAFADDLARRIREHFWVDGDDGRYLAMALDAAGEAVTGVGSNMGHALGTGTLTPAEAAEVARVLTGPTLLRRGGIGTLATDNGGFNPLGYHTGSVWIHDTAICASGLAREGLVGPAVEVARRVVATGTAFGGRLPELFADGVVLDGPAPYPASCRPQAWAAAAAVEVVRIAVGFVVDAPARTVTIDPPRPLAFGAVRVAGFRAGDAALTIEVGADGGVTCTGLPADWRLLP